MTSSAPKVSGGQSGISLLGVIIALGILGIITVVMTQMLTNSMSTQQHLDNEEELRSLRVLIEKRLSCSKTITKAILATCSPNIDLNAIAAGSFFSLKDKQDKYLGVRQSDGSTQMGSWSIKGRCTKSPTVNTIQIAVAKTSKKGGFATDPLTKKPLSWAPLYPAKAPLATNLCTDEIIGDVIDDVVADHIESKPMEVSKVAGCGDGLFGAILGGQTQLYKSTVYCPSNKIAVSGGAECMPGAGNKNLSTLIAGSPKGTMVASRPAADGQAWYVECCLKKGGVLGIGGKIPSPQSYVVCLDKPEKD